VEARHVAHPLGVPNRGEKSLVIRSLRSRRAMLLAGGCCSSLLALALPAPAFAQTTDQSTQTDQPVATGPGDVNAQPPEDKDAIVVTGIRRSIANSIAIKREERSMVEAVSAEEIGKLPDVSVAESIARLPGLAAQRVQGRAQIVSIRGFSPDFSTTLLNGRQQASSGYNRAVEFDQYPSELLSSVVVYKTPDASITGQGLAGTVDLRTIRPLAFGKRQFTVNLRGSLDEGGGRIEETGKYGWRGTVSYIDQNPSGTLGWAIGYAHLDQPGHTNHTSNWFYDNYAGLLPDGTPYILSGQELFAKSRSDIRDGVMGTLEWRPSDRVHTVLDLYYSRFKQHEVNRGAQWFSDAWVDGVTYSNLQTETRGNNLIAVTGHVGGTPGDPNTGVAPILRFDDNKRTDHLFAAGLNNEWKVTDRLRLLTDLSYSSNKRDETYIETYGGYGVGPSEFRTFDEYDFEIPTNDFPQFTGFGLNYADANQVSLGDRAPWGGWGHDGLKKSPHIKETLASGDATLRYDMADNALGGFFSSIEAGVDYTHRRKKKTVDELDLFLKNNRDQVLVDPQFLSDPTSLGFAGFGDVLGVRIADALDTYYDVVQLQDANHFDKAWKINEDITTFKAKANIDAGHLHGNVGLQVVIQKQESTGLRINQTVSPLVLTEAQEGAKYTDFLPNLNLYYDITNQHRLRFALAKVMMRPRMDDMRANLVPSFDVQICANIQPPQPQCGPGISVQPWSASGGNPKLEPWRAKELDLAYEWYGGKATYFSVNGFYYWLDNWIYTQVLPGDFSDFPLPPGATSITNTGATIDSTGPVSMPANGKGGWLAGVEVSGALELGRLTRLLDGFGVQGSVSYSDYHLPPVALNDYGGVLPGFSKWVYNLTGYYEKNGFQARASYRYRSAFKGEVVSLFTNLGYPKILADKQLDAQIGYTFQKGSRLDGLGIVLQVSNVLDSPYRTSFDLNGTQTLETFEKYGRQWLLGASYHF
jgi:iron complex outermembrane receptor protein